jgi:hypothetical protein
MADLPTQRFVNCNGGSSGSKHCNCIMGGLLGMGLKNVNQAEWSQYSPVGIRCMGCESGDE